MFKYLALISVIILGCSLDGSGWGVIGILALVSAVLIGMAVAEETYRDTERARTHLDPQGGKGRMDEDFRDLRKAG